MDQILTPSIEQVRLFRDLFSGLPNVYGTYDPRSGKVRQVKRPVTARVIQAHLQGVRSYGVYLLKGNKIWALAVDFDDLDPGPPLELIMRARQYELAAYLEKSKSKGFHIWFFFESAGVLARDTRLVVRFILREMQMPDIEIFPKQDALSPGIHYGNFVNAPLFGALVPKGRTVFLCPETLQPFSDQWDLLKKVERISQSMLREIIEINEMEKEFTKAPAGLHSGPAGSRLWGLPPCACRMLEQGVHANQRVACFRLAIQMRRLGLPQDIVVGGLEVWAQKNKPIQGKRIITQEEIKEQVGWAYKRDYRSCGCEDAAIRPYCDPECPLYERTHSRKRSGRSRAI